MPAKRKSNAPPPEETYICSFCGKEIHGEHVYIKTKRRSELRIHFECMPGKGIKS
jgi:ribosome-binding protein aMBF1 (putative translation factor)